MAVSVRQDGRVSDLELFFDLVFVFAITQVTALMAHETGWAGIGKGMLVLTVLWLAWAAFAWLTNNIDPEEGAARGVIFATMVGLLVCSLAVPHAFDDDAMLFGAAYCFVRTMQLGVYALSDVRLARAIAPGMLLPGVLVLAAGFFEGPARYLLWMAAVAANVLGPYLGDRSSWRINPGHFSERHGLFIIIALGESIVAAGVGIGGKELDLPLLVSAGLVVVATAGLWWTYFDIGVHVAARKLAGLEGDERNRLARDSFTFIHLPMVAGIVLFALGVKKALEHVDEPLDAYAAVALCGGLALYMAGQVAFRIRNVAQLSRRRSVLTLVLLALIPVAHAVDAAVALALVAAAYWGLIAYELLRYGEARQRMRHTEEMPA